MALLPSPSLLPGPVLPGAGETPRYLDGTAPAPTVGDVFTRSPLLRERYPGDEDADLIAAIEDATIAVADITGRMIPPVTTGEAVPDGSRRIAVRAVARMAELMDTQSSAAMADQDARGRRLRGFSAGPYSEQYFGPDDLVPRRGQAGRPAMSSDPQLDALLWALATEDARNEFIARATGIQAPGDGLTAFDYRRTPGSMFGPRFGARRGPDGF